MAETLEIAGGTTAAVNLKDPSGTNLIQWKPKVTPWKDGGVVQDSKVSEAQKLRYRQFGIASELFRVNHVGTDQDAVMAVLRLVAAKLEEAVDYWLNKQNDSPVYLHVKGANETNDYYALIHKYQVDEFEEIFRSGFVTGGHAPDGNTYASVIKEFKAVLNRGHWLGNAPGSSQCVQASSAQEWWYAAEWSVNTSSPSGQTAGMLQTSSGRILIGDTGQILYSDDDCDSWAQATALPTALVYSIIQTISGRILACDSNDVWYSDDDGDTWNSMSPYGYILLQTSSGRILLGQNGQISYSDDDGDNWAILTTDPASIVYTIIQTSSGRILAGDTGQIWYSDDDGDNLDLITTVFSNPVYTLLQTSTDKILAGTYGKIWGSEDDGDTWYIIDNTVVQYVNDIFQTSFGTIYAGVFGAIWISNDDGITWEEDTADPVSYVLIKLETASHKILAGESGQIWINPYIVTTMGASSTCSDIVCVANKNNIANLTDIYVDNGGVWGDNFIPMTSFPYSLLPTVPATNDAIYFGISTDIDNAGPFDCLVFDLASAILYSGSYTIVWEYWDSATWSTLTVKDGTDSGVGAFRMLGVNSVHWLPPSDWATRDISSDGGPSVTGWFVRARVSALSGTITPPTQQNRSIYSVVNGYINIASAQVPGDISMLGQIKLHNRSDEDGASGSAPDLWTSRLFIGLKETTATDTFQAYVNISDEQNPVGVDVSVGTNTTFSSDNRAPSGRCAVYNPSGAESMTTRATIILGPSIARDFYGQYRAFLRVQRTAGVYTDFDVRLRLSTGSGGITETTDSKQVYSTQEFDCIDFGQITLPVSGQIGPSELGDQTTIDIQASAGSGTPNLNLYDLVLIPVDGWSADPTDIALESDSEIGRSGGYDKYLSIDSLTIPKDPIRTIVRRIGSELITSIYKPVTPAPVQLFENADQRLWFLAMRGILEGSHTGANNAAVLTDSAVNFLLAGVKVGMTIYNVTDGSSAEITAITATTVTGTLSGGTDDDWDTSDEYYVICPHWVADPEICHSIQINGNPRYLYPRGAA